MTEPAWVFDKPLTLKGGPGSTTWSDLRFAARTISLRWKATPADAGGCSIAYTLVSKALPKALRGTSKSKGAKPVSGRKDVAIRYGDGSMTITSDCASWGMKIVSTGHPGVVVKQKARPKKIDAATAIALNDGLADAATNWTMTTSYVYVGSSRPRVTSKKIIVSVRRLMPKWTPPDGTDPVLIADWKAAVKGMNRHLDGQVAIIVQSAGRYLATLTKTKFRSKGAIDDYLDDKGQVWFEWADDAFRSYDEATDYGASQHAYIE